ncbi:hypothetical protein [Siminovitchia fortis]|uniref:hypothetical protein n=1 Tax=Siminovitchia fortis TaxID=254758 RepID=UPI0011A80089|nr:hypothetical protein [Siminovitchia fortis]
MVNIKATVISWPNQYGVKQFDDYLKTLQNRAQRSHNDAVKFAFVLNAIDFMRFVSLDMLPQNEEERFMAELKIELGGKTYSQSFRLIKPLRKENIYELRIDFSEKFYWRFRTIFFPYVHNGDLFHCFVFPFEKTQQVKFNLTDHFRDKAFALYHDLQNDPGKYVNCFE